MKAQETNGHSLKNSSPAEPTDSPDPADVVSFGVSAPSPFPALTSRERQIASMLAVGFVNREIADNLDISIKTVDTHRGHILKKLGLRNNVELAREALRVGLVTLDVDTP